MEREQPSRFCLLFKSGNVVVTAEVIDSERILLWCRDCKYTKEKYILNITGDESMIEIKACSSSKEGFVRAEYH